MNRHFETFKYAMSMIGIFVFLGLVGAGLWHLVELFTGYTATIVKMAGYWEDQMRYQDATNEELARNALEFMSDQEIGQILLEEFGERSHAIEHILEGNGTVVERLARQERDYLAVVETDRLYEYDYQ